jgi:hypothetical protein
MAEIVNLRLHRKRQARADKEQHAAENRAKFGQTKPERDKARAQQELSAKKLDGHKREE